MWRTARSSASSRRPTEHRTTRSVRARLLVYHKNTEELIPHYRKQGLLHEVDGQGEIEQVYRNIIKTLKPQADRPC